MYTPCPSRAEVGGDDVFRASQRNGQVAWTCVMKARRLTKLLCSYPIDLRITVRIKQLDHTLQA